MVCVCESIIDEAVASSYNKTDGHKIPNTTREDRWLCRYVCVFTIIFSLSVVIELQDAFRLKAHTQSTITFAI